MPDTIRAGFIVVQAETGEPLGVVRDPDGDTFTAFIDGHGELEIPLRAVRRLEEGAVLIEPIEALSKPKPPKP